MEKKSIKRIVERIRIFGIRSALKQQGLKYWYTKCFNAVTDISDQYTGSYVSRGYKTVNVRAMHAFQVSMFDCWWYRYAPNSKIVKIADMGDSSGNHSLYLKHVYGSMVKTVSYNIDPVAVEKIKSKGLNAIHIEEDNCFPSFSTYDAVMAWQVLEHLEDPILCLKSIDCDYLIASTPFMRRSRVGLHSIRNGKTLGTKEDEHIFELSPTDWELLLDYAGWDLLESRIYYQYPRGLFSWLWKIVWYNDYEGFWSFIAKRKE